MRHAVLTSLVALFASSSYAMAGSWAEAMLSQLHHDLGSVPRGANTHCEFVITNRYDAPVRISGLKRTCGCTLITLDSAPILNAKVAQATTQKVLKPGEQAKLGVTLDTRKFVRDKSAQITIYFDKPRSDEVRLTVRSFIRQDVVFNPGAIQFGTVPRSRLEPRDLKIEYAGRQDWKIVQVSCPNPNLEAKCEQLYRRPKQVGYRLSVGIKPSAPAGSLRDFVILRTNDPESPKLPVLVEAQLLPELVVTPAELYIGPVRPMQTARRFVLLRSKNPFRVLNVTGLDKRFGVEFVDRAQNLHTVKFEFKGSLQPGTYEHQVHIATDLPGETAAKLKASVRVIP